jgi:Ca2+-binding RTX toxin-like protein
MQRGALLIVSAVAALAVPASPAGAVPAVGTVEVHHAPDVIDFTYVSYTGLAGAEQLTVSSSNAQETATFSTPNGFIVANDEDCTLRLIPRRVSCSLPGTFLFLVTAYGGLGDDRISASGDVETELGGASGNDVLISNALAARLNGGEGLDILRGGPGHEILAGGTGRDQMYGGGGDDDIDARDGRADEVVDCGAGNDRATVDPGEPTIDCEDVLAF